MSGGRQTDAVEARPDRGSAVSYPMRTGAGSSASVRPPLAPLDLAELSALSGLPLRARCLADAVGAGHHRSRRKGANVEFADYRDYQPGDDLRRIDWRLYARTDRLQMREAHEETPLRIQLLLDVSASMAYRSRDGLLTKLDLARAVLAAIALLARRQREACGVGILADDLLHFAAPGRSPHRWRAVWAALETPPVRQPTALALAWSRAAEAAPPACLFVVASDFYEDPEAVAAVVRRLHFDGHDVLALHLSDPAEWEFPFTDPAEFADAEDSSRVRIDPVAAARRYREAFTAHQRALAEVFRGSGFDYLSLRTDASPLSALAAYLARRAGKGS